MLKAAETDQPEITESIHEYFHSLAQNTKPPDMEPRVSQFDCPVDEKKLESFFSGLSVKCQQSLFLLNWKQIHDAIESPLCNDMMPPHLNEEDRIKLKKFLHTALDWNVSALLFFFFLNFLFAFLSVCFVFSFFHFFFYFFSVWLCRWAALHANAARTQERRALVSRVLLCSFLKKMLFPV